MLTKRIIACLDVRDGKVVKGVKFKNHQVVGDIVPLAKAYSEQGIDELVFYDITASSDRRLTSTKWITAVADQIAIPFSVAGGITSLDSAKAILHAGADKISINSPALADPGLIDNLSAEFGSQCVTVGIDSLKADNDYWVYQYTGDASKTVNSKRKTIDWIEQVQQRGAGEIVLNCMSSDGVKAGYDLNQLVIMAERCRVPLIASGGAGSIDHFISLFHHSNVSGALAASVFHKNLVDIGQLKKALCDANIEVRYEKFKLG